VELGGKYLLSARDLCMIEHVHELIDVGVDVFKIEDRLRDLGYAAVVSRCYRKALDACRNGSSWILTRIIDVTHNLCQIKPFFGIPLATIFLFWLVFQ